MGLVRHGVEGQHNPRDLIDPCLRGRSLEQASAEHVVERPMASLVDSVALGMVRRGKGPLDPQRAQQLRPDVANKLESPVRKKPARSAKVRDHVAQEGFVHRVCGVIAGWYQYGVPGVAIHEHDEELLEVIGWQRSHNVDGQRVPGTLRLNGTSRLLTMAIIAAQLTLATTLRCFEANAATGFMRIVTRQNQLMDFFKRPKDFPPP